MTDPRNDAAEVSQAVPALSGDEALALLRTSESAYQAGELAAAKAGFERLITEGKLVEWANFFLGRIYRDESNDSEAMAAFTRAIDADSAMFWAHFERLVLACETDEPVARRSEMVDAMVAIGWEPLAGGNLRKAEMIAHAQWDDEHIDDAYRIFAKLWPSAELDQLTLFRIVEANRDPEIAAAARRRLEEAGDLEEISLRLLIQHHERRGDAGAMLALIDGRELRPATQVRAWSSLARHYAQNRKRHAAAGGTEQSPEDTALAARLYDFARTLVESPVERLAGEQVSQLELIAHVLWDAGYTDSAHRVFARLWPSPDLGTITLVRIVEADRDAAMITEAVKRLEAKDGLDEIAMRILSDYHARQGDVGHEIARLERRQKAAPLDFQTWVALARSYARKGERSQAMETLDKGQAFPLRQRTFAHLIVLVELGAAKEALLDFRTLARLYDEFPKYPGIRLTYLFSDAQDVARRDEMLALLAARYADDKEIALLEVNVAIRDQRWADARALFDANLAELDPKPQNVRLANIDILAFSGQLEEASALLEQERASGSFPLSFLRSSLRILGELERWGEMFELGLEHLAEDVSFEHFLATMIRAARKTDRSGELLDALLALPKPLKHTQQEAVFAVMEDLAETGRDDIFERIGDIEVPYERDHRIRLKLRALSDPANIEKDLCIYYCADRNYLMPALVSLTSLAMSNVSVARRTVFHLVVDQDIVPLATEAGGAIARRLGFALEIVDASTIVSSADRLRTSYGLFTGGQQLALAAYYRIFFARHLVDQGKFSQALYVDADTIVRIGLEELFAADHAAPIMARYETDRPEVRHATAIHQLQGRYFNSGVLHFDLAHPDLPALLDKAIAAAIDPDVTLIFQDQCALNIAFDMQMNELPSRFNYFNPPSVSGDGIAATDAVIVHFLDRPKPWDSLYRRRAREWFEWFDLVETLRQGYAAPSG